MNNNLLLILFIALLIIYLLNNNERFEDTSPKLPNLIGEGDLLKNVKNIFQGLQNKFK